MTSRALLLAAVLAGGCTEARTEVVVVVNEYGLTIGRDIDGLQLVVKTHAGDSEPIFSTDQHPLCPAGQPQSDLCWSLPLTATLVPGPDHPNDPVVVQLFGLRSGAQVIGDQATFRFVTHVSQQLDFVLYANCLNVDCTAQNAACNFAGQCQTVMPTTFNGEPQLDGPTPPDLGGAGDLRGADLASPRRDLAFSDLAFNDLAFADLASLRDLASGDLASLRDLASGDLAVGDLAHSDLSQSDLSSTDLAVPNDDLPVPAWSQLDSTSSANLRAVWGTDSANLFVVGDQGTILHSSDGTHWNAENAPLPNDLYSVWGDSINVFAVGQSGTLLQRSGGGPDWTQVSLSSWSTTPDFRGVWGQAGNFYVVGKNGELGQGSGSSWTELCSNHGTDYLGIWGSDGLNVWVVGSSHFVGVLQPQATCFLPPSDMSSCGPTCPLPATSLTSAGTLFDAVTGNSSMGALTVGPAGSVLTCDHSSCLSQTSPGAFNLNGTWAGTQSTFVVGDGGQIAVLSNSILSWSAETSQVSANLNGVWGDNLSAVWAVGDAGTILIRQ